MSVTSTPSHPACFRRYYRRRAAPAFCIAVVIALLFEFASLTVPYPCLGFLFGAGLMATIIALVCALKFIPSVQNCKLLNGNSPFFDSDLNNWLFDKALPTALFPEGCRTALAYDVGGTGQIAAESDPRGRFSRIIPVSDNPSVLASVEDAIPRLDPATLANNANLIIMSGLVEYLDTDEKLDDMMNDAYKVLKPGGVVVISESRFIFAWSRRIWSWITSAAVPIKYRSEEEIGASLLEANFIIDREYIFTPKRGIPTAFIILARK